MIEFFFFNFCSTNLRFDFKNRKFLSMNIKIFLLNIHDEFR